MPRDRLMIIPVSRPLKGRLLFKLIFSHHLHHIISTYFQALHLLPRGAYSSAGFVLFAVSALHETALKYKQIHYLFSLLKPTTHTDKQWKIQVPHNSCERKRTKKIPMLNPKCNWFSQYLFVFKKKKKKKRFSNFLNYLLNLVIKEKYF